MEDTQAINWEVEEEEETERPSDSLGSSLEPFGRLHVFSSTHGPEKDFPLYLGKNVVGRMPDCTVALPFPTISKQHAVIEVLARNKAPVLRDCGSLNGTQILRPPKFLSPGVSHRLRDQELVVFADLPCQYHRLDVSLPFVSWGPLTVQETPRVQGGTQPWGNLLAEDSEEEVDALSERRVVEEPRTTFPLLATVVPESDEEGPSSVPDGPGPPCAFNFDSDTDEEESPHPAAGEACSAATRDATAETEQPKAVATEIQCEMNQHSGKERSNDTRAERDAGNGVVPVGMILERSQPAREDSDTDVDDESRPPGRSAEVHLERAQPSGFIDSDTDMEEEEIPATPAVVPVKKRQIFHGVSTASPGGSDLAHLQESLDGSDTDVETEAPLIVLPGRSQASMVINSNTDDEEEVSAALTLARLKESHGAMWNRDINMTEDQAQPLALLEQSQTSSGRDSDTEVKEEKFPVEKREYVPKGHTDKAHSEKSQPPLGASVREVEEDESSPGVHLERSQASATVGISTQVEEEIPPGPAVTLPEKHQVPVAWTDQTNVKAEGGPAKLPVMHQEEARPPPGGDSEAAADVRKSQFPTERVAGTEWVVYVRQQEGALETGAQGEPPVAQVEQDHLLASRENVTDLLVDTGTPGEPPQPQRKGAQPPREREREPCVDMTEDSGDNNHDDSENLDLQATQCFVERENQSVEGALDEPWEVLATQPFCVREFEASDTQPVAAHLEAHGSCPFSPRATPGDQHPESPLDTEPLGIQGRGMQTAEKGMSPPRESAERVALEGGPLGRETETLPLEGLRENVRGEEELTRATKDREQKQVLAGDTERQESNKMVKSGFRERDMESLKVEIETPKELQEMVKQTLAKEEREAEKPAAERKCEPGGLEVSIPKVILEGGAQRLDTKRGSVDQKGPASSPTLEPEGGAGDLMGLSSALIASGSQSGGRRGAPSSHGRWQRGHLSCKTPPAERVSRGDPESLDACVPATVPEASAPGQNPFICQNQKHPAPQPRFAPSPPFLEPPIPRTRQSGSQEVLENPSSSELDPLHAKPKVRPRGCSKIMSSLVSSIASESHSSASKDQLVTPEPTSRATRGRTQRSSVKTPEPVVPAAPELQPSTSKDQPATPEPTSRATRGRTRRSSVKTPEPVVPTAPELQPSTSKDQPATPEPTSRATRGRTRRFSVKTPEPVVPTAPELQPSTSKDQPATPEPTSRATRGRTRRFSVKTPEPVVPTAPELQPSTSKDQPATPEPTSRATRGRTQRFSVKTPKLVPAAPECQPSTSKDQLVTPESTSQATRGRTQRSSVKTPEPVVPAAPEYQPATPKTVAQSGWSRTLRTGSAAPVPATPEFQSPGSTDQPVSSEPIPQANCSRRPRATRKNGSLTTPIVYEPCSAPLERNFPSRNQRREAVRVSKSLRAIPKPAFAQLPEAPTHVPQIQQVEAGGRCEFTPKTQPKAFQNRKRPFRAVDSPPLQKRPRRGQVRQKTVFLKEEEDPTEKEEHVVLPGPGKRERDQAEKPKGVPGRSLRRTKPKQESTAPKVLFTGVVDARGEQALLALGGSLASSVAEASHLVTDRIRRTVKFLCALGRGIPILSLDWLHQSHKAGCFLPPDEYVVTDSEQEKNFGFSLRDSLSRARERRLLEGYEIHVTPGVQPPPPQMAEIISCCGGTVLPSMPRSYKPQRVVITCSQDLPRCNTPIRVGLPILSPEFLLTGVLKQEARPEAFVLSTVEMSCT